MIRNAGGVVTDEEIRSLAISQNLLGTEEIVLIHHTDCGMLTFSDEEFADRLERETGSRPAWDAHAFSDLEEDLRASIERIRESPFIPRKESVRGFVYEVETGRLREVAEGRPRQEPAELADRDHPLDRQPRPLGDLGGTLTSNFISRSESRSFGRVIIFMYLQKAIRLASIRFARGATC